MQCNIISTLQKQFANHCSFCTLWQSAEVLFQFSCTAFRCREDQFVKNGNEQPFLIWCNIFVQITKFISHKLHNVFVQWNEQPTLDHMMQMYHFSSSVLSSAPHHQQQQSKQEVVKNPKLLLIGQWPDIFVAPSQIISKPQPIDAYFPVDVTTKFLFCQISLTKWPRRGRI